MEKRVSKRRMKNERAEKTKLMQDRAELVRAAMEIGNCVTKTDICKATALSMVILNNLFTEDRKLYAEYVILRKTITDIAADNITAIVNNKEHPQHFQASKYILQNFKSDFDETLDGSDNVLQISPTSGKRSNAVKIVFSSNKKE